MEHVIPRALLRRGLSLVSVACLFAMAASAAPMSAPAAEPDDPDWPCIQRLVPELAVSQMWAGPAPDGVDDRSGDGETAGLARQLASRSMPIDQAQTAIDRFAGSLPPQERNAQLTHLFHEVLQLINQERGEIIGGIKRYTRKQRHLAEKIAQDSQKLANLQPGTTPDAATQELLSEREWDLRVFHDRQRVLTQICEQPVLMEQRAFSLSRAMQAQLEPN